MVSLNEPDIFKDSFFLHYFLIENLLLATVTLWLAQLGSLMFRKLQDRFQYVNVFDLIGTQKTVNVVVVFYTKTCFQFCDTELMTIVTKIYGEADY